MSVGNCSTSYCLAMTSIPRQSALALRNLTWEQQSLGQDRTVDRERGQRPGECYTHGCMGTRSAMRGISFTQPELQSTWKQARVSHPPGGASSSRRLSSSMAASHSLSDLMSTCPQSQTSGVAHWIGMLLRRLTAELYCSPKTELSWYCVHPCRQHTAPSNLQHNTTKHIAASPGSFSTTQQRSGGDPGRKRTQGQPVLASLGGEKHRHLVIAFELSFREARSWCRRFLTRARLYTSWTSCLYLGEFSSNTTKSDSNGWSSSCTGSRHVAETCGSFR
eukprot:1811435-Rhodomonas_salina.1